MTHKVFIQDVFPQYYSYMRHAARCESADQPLWQAMNDRTAFEEKWFIQQGIGLIKSTRDDRTLCMMVFEDRNSFILWLLKWS